MRSPQVNEAQAAGVAADIEPLAAAGDLEGLCGQLTEVLVAAGVARDDTIAGVLRDLRALAARAAPREREVRILRGICRRLQHALKTAGSS